MDRNPFSFSFPHLAISSTILPSPHPGATTRCWFRLVSVTGSHRSSSSSIGTMLWARSTYESNPKSI